MTTANDDRGRTVFAETCARHGFLSQAKLIESGREEPGDGAAVCLDAMRQYAAEREAATVERCARVAEQSRCSVIGVPSATQDWTAKAIATAIRESRRAE